MVYLSFFWKLQFQHSHLQMKIKVLLTYGMFWCRIMTYIFKIVDTMSVVSRLKNIILRYAFPLYEGLLTFFYIKDFSPLYMLWRFLFFIPMNLIEMCFGVIFFVFLMIRIHWISWISNFVIFIKFWNLSRIILSSLQLCKYILGHSVLSYRSLMPCSHFSVFLVFVLSIRFVLFPLVCLHIHWSSERCNLLLILSSVFFCL